MSTIPTQNPVPSEAAKDLKFNAGKIDELVTSDENFFVDRFGNKKITLSGLERSASTSGPAVEAAIDAMKSANDAANSAKSIEINSSKYVEEAELYANASKSSAIKAEGHEINSKLNADKALSAADSIVNDAKIFSSVENGLSGTSNGDYFRVWQNPETGSSFIYYWNNNGVAKELTNTISKNGVISLIAPHRLSNMFDDGGFKKGIAPKVKGSKITPLFGELIDINDGYLLGIGCERGVKKASGDSYDRGLFCAIPIPDGLVGKYVIMSAIVVVNDNDWGGDGACSYLGTEKLQNIIDGVSYTNYRNDISSNKRCYATCVKITPEAKYLHIGKGGVSNNSNTVITSVFYSFCDYPASIENIKWDSPYSASDIDKIVDDKLYFDFEENIIKYGDLDGGIKNPMIRSGSSVIDLTTQESLLNRGYSKAIQWRLGNEFVGIEATKVNGEYVGGYFLVHASNNQDFPSVKRAQIFTQTGGVIAEAENIDGGYKEVGESLYLMWGYYKIPSNTEIVWLGSASSPKTAERYATGFSLFSSEKPFSIKPALRRLTQRNMSKLVLSQYLKSHTTPDPSGKAPEIISIVNSDKIVILGDSYTESMHTLKDKSYAANVSMLTDWRIEPYGVSGHDCIMMNQRIIDNAPTFGWGIKDMGASHVMLMSQTNDAGKRSVSYRFWQSDLQRAIQSILAIGAKPIVSTEHPKIEAWAYGQMNDAAISNGADFFDIASNAHQFEFNTDPKLWVGSHPGTRTNSVIWNGVLKNLESMPRPRTGIKIFRVRSPNLITSISQLLYDDINDRASLFKEITLGHTAISENDARYYDDLTAYNAENVSRERHLSEYGTLAKGQSLLATKYILLEVILPAFASDIQSLKVVIDASSHELYAINRLTQPEFTQSLYKAFISSETNVIAGDKYTDSLREFTVVGKVGDKIILSPNRDPKDSSGTLTKVSGSGADSLSYTSVEQGFDPNYYSHFDDKKGKWEKVGLDFNSDNLAKYMQGDKLSLLLVSEGELSLNDVRFEYTGGDNKPVISNKHKLAGVDELLTNTKFDTSLTGWDVTGGVSAYQPDQGNPPTGTSHVVAIGAGKSISQKFKVKGSNYGQLLKCRVWCRRKVPLFSPSSDFSTSKITSDSFDFRKLSLYIGGLNTDLNKSTEIHKIVGLGWQEVTFDYYHVGGSQIDLKATLQSDDDIEVSYVSIV
ncbi:hypothetical protein [Proteus penneri]|uniref:hypothetical protein n=1 Tax=Proteus penneri TaxID=102862 RepID=UPI0034D54BB2